MEYKDKILYYIDKLSLLREDYVEAHRTIIAKYNYDYRDARVAVFTKCTITMNTAFVGFILIREELLDSLWWKEHISELDGTAITRQIEDFEAALLLPVIMQNRLGIYQEINFVHIVIQICPSQIALVTFMYFVISRSRPAVVL